MKEKNKNRKSWLIGLPQPPKLLLYLSIILVIILAFRSLFAILSKIVYIAIIITLISLTYNYLHWPNKITHAYVPHSSKKLVVNTLPNQTIQITDNGFFKKKRSIKNFIAFDLKPYLIKQYGTKTIEKVILNKPSARSFEAVNELCNTFTLREVEVPYFKKSLSRRGLKRFFSLKERLESEGVLWTRVGRKQDLVRTHTHRKI